MYHMNPFMHEHSCMFISLSLALLAVIEPCIWVCLQTIPMLWTVNSEAAKSVQKPSHEASAPCRSENACHSNTPAAVASELMTICALPTPAIAVTVADDLPISADDGPSVLHQRHNSSARGALSCIQWSEGLSPAPSCRLPPLACNTRPSHHGMVAAQQCSPRHPKPLHPLGANATTDCRKSVLRV